MSPAPPLLELRDLHVWFELPAGGELHALRGINLFLAPGQRLGLVGESGCGKSTAILAIMGLLPPTASVSGQVLLDGVDLLGGGERTIRPHRWSELAVVFQGTMNALNPVKTVGSQIAEPMKRHGIASGRAARGRVEELLEMVRLSRSTTGRFPHELSGGMRQRACLAMALACRPRVLLADEPTTALDVIVQAQILELLVDVCRESDLALVLVTHDLPVVMQVCEVAAVVQTGRIVDLGATEALSQGAQHPYTRRLFDANVELYGRADRVGEAR